jgi:hypothetical protein
MNQGNQDNGNTTTKVRTNRNQTGNVDDLPNRNDTDNNDTTYRNNRL